MKPCLTTTAFIAALCCAVSTAVGQTPGSVLPRQGEVTPSPVQAPASPLWGSPPPPPWAAPLPYGDLWLDYCPEKTTRHLQGANCHISIHQPKPVKNFVVTLCGWFENLFCGRQCNEPTPACLNCAAGPVDPPFEPAQLPYVPRAPVVNVAPPLPQPDEQMILPKVAAPPPPAVVESQPSQPPKPLETPEEPKSIHGAVVELAPDFVLPPEQQQRLAPPRNVIPKPGVTTPRNTVPAQ